ncbi:lycopene cyclase domain-containing protein [Nocardia goodfellowii]|uniref:Lycopene cyclase domain-containing protein n=1 Tax=Nocardia goodfellowii TaxID=882446 RepID=A0ABS4QIN7_9NOCA|nr:lycopene cyclase domain-containing protein [Nocardia goodfellowii]MBP2191572.1 lycopene cyclase domain-containing protein [Nocardia goodfellowii]
MTYSHFLGVFILPALLLAVLLAAFTLRARGFGTTLRIGAVTLGVLVVVAVGWTTPWDSWIIRQGVWSYPPNSVTGTVFRVPFEELGFMAAQVLIVGIWTLTLIAHRVAGYHPDGPWPWASAPLNRLGATSLWTALVIVGFVLAVSFEHLLYFGSSLVLTGIPLALQRAVGADVLRRFRLLRLCALAPVAFFVVADRVAIDAGAWSISSRYTTGWEVGGLPVEEIAFFTLTSLLVIDGLVLACHPEIHRRLPIKPKALRRSSDRRSPQLSETG